MDQLWQWLTSLPSSTSAWPLPPPSLALASHSGKSILLRADAAAGGAETEASVLFSISLHGFDLAESSATLWTSNPFPLSSPLTPYSLLSQLLQEIISLSPTPSIILPPGGQGFVPTLDTGPIRDALEGEPSTAPAFFALALLCRLFWLCAVGGAPAEAGFIFFRSVGRADLARALDCRPALRRFLAAVGPDWEELFMRSVGYVVAKWCILRELQTVLVVPAGGVDRLPSGFCPSYVAEAHGLWVLKGYAPVSAMTRVCGAAPGEAKGRFDVRDSVLRYALAHQQLEAVIQLEYTVSTRDPRYIGVTIRVHNIRLHVVRLGFGKKEDDSAPTDDDNSMQGERHFPSRIRIWAGPELGSAYATGPSLGRSTANPERETEWSQTIKGRLGTGKFPAVKARARSSVRSRGKDWQWEQEAEGNAGVFEGALYDGATGAEVAGGGGGRGMSGGTQDLGRKQRAEPIKEMSLKEEFEVHAAKAKNLPASTTNENLLILYGLYKQATVGPVNTDRPGMFSPRERAKWDAWKAVEAKSKDEAMGDYITKVKQLLEEAAAAAN